MSKSVDNLSCWHAATDILVRDNNMPAGELVALQALTNVLNYLKVQTINIIKVCFSGQLAAIKLTIPRQLTEKFGITKVKEMLKDIMNCCYDRNRRLDLYCPPAWSRYDPPPQY